MNPRLDLYAQDGSIFTNEPIYEVLPEQGLIQYKVSDYVIRHEGKVDAKLFLENENSSVHVANFYFVITDSGVTGAIGKEIKIDILDDKVKKVILDNQELFKGETGEKLKFSDLSSNEKLEIKGERGLQGVRGDTPNFLIVNGEYDFTAYQPIAPDEFNAMRYFRDTSNSDEFMKGFDNYVASQKMMNVDYPSNEDFNSVTKGKINETVGNNNPYATEIGTTIEHRFTGYSISFNSIKEQRGGIWKATIDGVFVKNISTWGTTGIATVELITDKLENTEHVLTLEFIGQDPEHPTSTPRGWIRFAKYQGSSGTTFTVVKRTVENKIVKTIDVAYPSSNKEYAIAVRPKGSTIGSEFFPYHGVQTSFKGENYVRKLIVDGLEVDLTKKSEKINFKEAKLIQKVSHKLPTDDNTRMEATFIATFKDNRVYNEVRFKWLKPSQVTSGFVFQLPVSTRFLTSLLVDDKEQIDKSLNYGSQSDFQNDDATIYRAISDDSVGKDYVYQCVVTSKAKNVDRLWLQHRDENLQKLYPQYYNMTNREIGEVDVFKGYYEIQKIKDANILYKL